MSAPELRPHFDLIVEMAPDAAMARLDERFQNAPWVGRRRGHHGQLGVPKTSRHLWSPWLSFEATIHDDGTLLTGRFAPHPSIWTGYMAAYGVVIFSMFGLGCFGLSQWMAGQPPTMLWTLPIGLALLGMLYGSAFVGQRLTAEQMARMRTFMVGCFDGEARWAPEGERG